VTFYTRDTLYTTPEIEIFKKTNSKHIYRYNYKYLLERYQKPLVFDVGDKK